MAESILTRGFPTIPEDILDPIPVTSTTHGIKVTLKDYEGNPMVEYPISCKDGSSYYNYTTNEKGQTIFSINSGAANILVNNYNGSYQYLDINAKWTNIDAPVGMTTRANIEIERCNTSFYEFTSNKLFGFYKERNCNITLVGGGGGGGGGSFKDDDSEDYYNGGGGGGAGYMNNYNSQLLNGQYNFIIGVGGSGGRGGSTISGQSKWGLDGSSGGTSYIVSTNYSAVGGSGGKAGPSNQFIGNGGEGGLGNGRGKDNKSYNSPVDFAGGGGGGGSGYGSYSYNNYWMRAGTPYGGNGGNGLMRINIIY